MEDDWIIDNFTELAQELEQAKIDGGE